MTRRLTMRRARCVVLGGAVGVLVGALLPGGSAVADGTGPQWVQSFGRFGDSAACLDGWTRSWQEWAAPATGGWVCTRSVPADSPSSAVPPVLASTTRFATQGAPFAALQTDSGELLVSVGALPPSTPPGAPAAGIEVFTPRGDTYESRCVVRLPATVPYPEAAMVMGQALFDDGRYVGAAAEDNGLALYRVADLVACRAPTPVLVSQVLNAGESLSGTLDVAFTADGDNAFVANEYGQAPGSGNAGNIGVTAIDLAADGTFTERTRLLRQLGLPGSTLAGVLLSPDGSRLYVTTEVAPAGTVVPGGDSDILGGQDRCWQPSIGFSAHGLLSVIDVAAALSGQGEPILQTVAAGCSPTRMAITADGGTLFLGARGDNRLLAFDTGALVSADPAAGLLGYASTGLPGSIGSSPVGVQLFDGDRLLLVADSNRFGTPPQGRIDIFDVSDPSQPRLVGRLPAGQFPRNVSLGADGTTLFVTDYLSNEVQVIRTTVT